MKWLFLMFVLDTSAGSLQPRLMLRQAFQSREPCEALGEALRLKYADASLKSFSICVPDSAFEDDNLQVQRLDH